ncbi:MAG TPA: hypothetical protein VEZ14_10215 [Dehalococcoidia bacterium]|nr:hypothetical protein [Dehalococcoidia bacterium]
MVWRIIEIIAGSVVLALLLFASGIQAPRAALAGIPPACAGIPPGVPGATTYRVFATLPAAAPAADGLCVTVPGVPGGIGAGVVIQAPPACIPISPPNVGAGPSGVNDFVWASWPTPGPCVAPGQTVVLEFTGPAGMTLGLLPAGSVTWNTPAAVVPGDATVWPASCPAGPAAAAPVLYNALAAVPVGGPYNGVCISIPGAGGLVNSPAVLVNPPGCAAPALAPPPPAANPVLAPFFSAAVNQMWVHWNAKCAGAGSLLIQFKGPPGLPPGLCAACATWLDGSVMGDVTISLVPSVGGIAQAPDVAALAPVSRTASGTNSRLFVGGGIAAAVLAVFVVAGAWVVRCRQRA